MDVLVGRTAHGLKVIVVDCLDGLKNLVRNLGEFTYVPKFVGEFASGDFINLE